MGETYIIGDCETVIPGFKLYRKDRATLNEKGRGIGGVALYIKDTLQSAEYDELNSKRCEGLWCKIYGNKGENFVVGVCYRSQEAGDNEVDQLFECFKLASDDNHRLLIIEDFNYLEILTGTYSGLIMQGKNS